MFNLPRSFPVARILGSSALVCALGAWALLFWSGCAGDIKGGASGDPLQALQLENASFALTVMTMLFTVAALVWPPARMTQQYLALMLAGVLFGTFVFWLLGILLQSWGTTACP